MTEYEAVIKAIKEIANITFSERLESEILSSAKFKYDLYHSDSAKELRKMGRDILDSETIKQLFLDRSS